MWKDKSFKVQCRLDYFLISNEPSNHASDCCIYFASNTDHSAVQINLIAKEFKQNKGPGFWNSILLCLKTIDMFPNYGYQSCSAK